MKNKFFLTAVVVIIFALSSVAQTKGTFTDSRDGKTYKTITIGTQTWMAENLAYKNGTGCWAYKNDATSAATFGYMYDWETATKVCPAGWHLPSKAEFETLIKALGGESVAGAKMKSEKYWSTDQKDVIKKEAASNNKNQTVDAKQENLKLNSSDFNGLPGGGFYVGNIFDYKGVYATWWTSTEENDNNAYYMFLNNISSWTQFGNTINKNAFYVRCVKN